MKVNGDYMPNWIIGHSDEKNFEVVKERFERGLKNQFIFLRKTTCPIIGKSCIGCDCSAYNEPVHPWKSLTNELKFEKWIAKLFNQPFTEPYLIHMELATCNKKIFSNYVMHYINDEKHEMSEQE